jgi:hypothetical protein
MYGILQYDYNAPRSDVFVDAVDVERRKEETTWYWAWVAKAVTPSAVAVRKVVDSCIAERRGEANTLGLICCGWERSKRMIRFTTSFLPPPRSDETQFDRLPLGV